MFRVIGITGAKRSGKNTVGALVKCLSDLEYIQVQLADPIKDGFDRLSGAGRELHKDLDEFGWTNRKAWQLFGTEAREAVGDDLIWCKVTLASIVYLARFHPRSYQGFFVPDLRFPHEEIYFRDSAQRLGFDFELWGVRSQRAGGHRDGHKSEAYYDYLCPDEFLDNNLTKFDLAIRVNELLKARP